MKIKIIAEVDDGEFAVGKVYEVSQCMPNGLFVYAIDEHGNMEAVYSYQFVMVG